MPIHFFLLSRVKSPLKDERGKKVLVDVRVGVSFDGKKKLSTQRSALSLTLPEVEEEKLFKVRV